MCALKKNGGEPKVKESSLKKLSDSPIPTDPRDKYKGVPAKDIRDPTNGRFVAGNPGGMGIAHMTKDRAKYHKILRSCVTDKDFEQVSNKLLELAKQGTPWATTELLNRLLGKPKQVAEVDIRQTHVDPQQVINNIAVILGLEEKDPDHIELEQKQIEKKEDG